MVHLPGQLQHFRLTETSVVVDATGSDRPSEAERPHDSVAAASASTHPSTPHQCNAATCAVAKVFGLPELLADILQCLGTRDVMAMRRVNRTCARIVENTRSLRAHLFVNPQWLRLPEDFMLLDLKLPGLRIQRDEPIEKGQWISITLDATAAALLAPPPKRPNRRISLASFLRYRQSKVSQLAAGKSTSERDSSISGRNGPTHCVFPQYSDMHIAQPPVLGLQAYFIAAPMCKDRSQGHPSGGNEYGSALSSEPIAEPHAIAKLSCESGITLGFVAETARSILSTQSDLSPHGNGSDRKMVFRAIVSFGEAARPPRKSRGTSRSVILLDEDD